MRQRGRDERARAAFLLVLAALAACGALVAPGSVSAVQLALVAAAAVLGTAALLSQLALALERTLQWSLRYPLENAVIVVGAGVTGAIAAIPLGALGALVLGATVAGTFVALRVRGAEPA